MNFDELTETAQEKAIANVCACLAGKWWESGDNEAVNDSILFAFAEAIGFPHIGDSGPGDFPGITNVELSSWSLDNGSVSFKGQLTADTAPALPWVDAIDRVLLTVGHNGTVIDTETHWENDKEATQAETDALTQAVQDAVSAALSAGRAEFEYKTGEESARDYCENNAFLTFDEDGDIIDE